MRPLSLSFAFAFAILLFACGGSEGTTEEPATSASGGGEGSGKCEGLGPTDSCMNEENFAQCQAAAAQCPGQVLSLESCPLQFRCP